MFVSLEINADNNNHIFSEYDPQSLRLILSQHGLIIKEGIDMKKSFLSFWNLTEINHLIAMKVRFTFIRIKDWDNRWWPY